jgi:hypothetical protein
MWIDWNEDDEERWVLNPNWYRTLLPHPSLICAF